MKKRSVSKPHPKKRSRLWELTIRNPICHLGFITIVLALMLLGYLNYMLRSIPDMGPGGIFCHSCENISYDEAIFETWQNSEGGDVTVQVCENCREKVHTPESLIGEMFAVWFLMGFGFLIVVFGPLFDLFMESKLLRRYMESKLKKKC